MPLGKWSMNSCNLQLRPLHCTKSNFLGLRQSFYWKSSRRFKTFSKFLFQFIQLDSQWGHQLFVHPNPAPIPRLTLLQRAWDNYKSTSYAVWLFSLKELFYAITFGQIRLRGQWHFWVLFLKKNWHNLSGSTSTPAFISVDPSPQRRGWQPSWEEKRCRLAGPPPCVHCGRFFLWCLLSVLLAPSPGGRVPFS